MKPPPIHLLPAGFISACCALLSLHVASAASSTALSNRTIVDSRNPYQFIDLVPKLIDVTQDKPDGRRFISFKTATQALTRPAGTANDTATTTSYFRLKVPPFAARGGGWGGGKSGLGTYYGLEVKSGGKLTNDLIYYKVGGEVPSPQTPASEWKSTSFNKVLNLLNPVIDIPVGEGTYFFKIIVGEPLMSSDSRKLNVSFGFKSARLCDASGNPVTTLDPTKPLWLLAHGRVDGEKSFRTMNHAVRKATGETQVVTVDWASGASDADSLNLGSGRNLVNLGRNLSGLLQREGFSGRGKVAWVGHSWGALVGYETASQFGKVDDFFALDPTTQAYGDYDDGPVKFAKVSARSTGVKGGPVSPGIFGSEAITRTCHFSIRLFSERHTGPLENEYFYHSLPRDWFIRAMSRDTADTYWPYFHDLLLRKGSRPKTPWGAIKTGGLSRFDLECHGNTFYQDNNDPKADVSEFKLHQYLLYTNRSGTKMEARRISKNAWSVEKH